MYSRQGTCTGGKGAMGVRKEGVHNVTCKGGKEFKGIRGHVYRRERDICRETLLYCLGSQSEDQVS